MVIALLFACVMSARAGAQTADTLSGNPKLFTAGDAALVAGFTAATLLAVPADKWITRELQTEARQANRVMQRSATVGRIWGFPGALLTGGGIYLLGTAQGNRRVQDVGLHTAEAVMLGYVVTGGIKMIAGRARPDTDSSAVGSFKLFRGILNDDYQSFPSGHSTGGFAFAAIVTAESRNFWPEGQWVVGSVTYGMAVLSGVSRIYNYKHWATDVVAGAAIGTITGLKVFRYQHSNPGNRLDKLFLKAGVQTSGGKWSPVILLARP